MSRAVQVLVRHPAPLRHIPRGKRTVEDALVRIETPARLTVLAPDALTRLQRQPSFVPELYLGEGALWTRLDTRQPIRHSPFHFKTVPLTPESFVAWLGSPQIPRDAGRADPAHAFRATPLAAAWNEPTPPRQGRAIHDWAERVSGGDPEPDSTRRLLDERARSAEDLVRFLDTEVRLCGDGVFLRSELVASPSGLREHLGLSSARFLGIDQPPVLRPDRAAAFLRSPFLVKPDPRLDKFLGRLTPGLVTDADLRVHANALPRFALSVAALLARKRVADPVPDDALRSWALRGRIGGIRPEEAHVAAAAALAFIQTAFDNPTAQRLLGSDLSRLGERIRLFEEHVLPRIRSGPAPDPEDEVGLAALAP